MREQLERDLEMELQQEQEQERAGGWQVAGRHSISSWDLYR